MVEQRSPSRRRIISSPRYKISKSKSSPKYKKSRSSPRSKASPKSKCGQTIAIKSNPKLWDSIKKKVTSGSKGGPSGKWSARKAQMVTQQYKSRGGKFKGSKNKKCNSLSKWSREKWRYSSSSHSKRKSGRYLPDIIHKHLSKSTQRKENKKKGSKRGKWVSYSPSVKRAMRKYKIV